MNGYEEEQAWVDEHVVIPQPTDEYHGVTEGDHNEHVHQAPAEPLPWPKELGKYGRLGVRQSDPRVCDHGEAVEKLLKMLGFNGDTYTVEVQEEVRQIQEEHKLPADGVVDQATWKAIASA